MDRRVKDLYEAFLLNNAKVINFLEYKNYYEIHLEWKDKPPYGISLLGPLSVEPESEWIRKVLIAFEKIRR